MPVVSDEDWIYGNRKYNVTHSYLTKFSRFYHSLYSL